MYSVVQFIFSYEGDGQAKARRTPPMQSSGSQSLREHLASQGFSDLVVVATCWNQLLDRYPRDSGDLALATFAPLNFGRIDEALAGSISDVRFVGRSPR